MRGVGASVGEDFLHDVPRMLAEALELDVAFVGELAADGERVVARWVWRDGDFVEPFVYGLAGSPCEHVMGRSLHVHPRGVSAQFPQDRELTAMMAESYLGAPLFDTDGEATGIVVGIGRRPMDAPDFAAVLFDIFSGRIGAELERWRAAERARRAEAHALQVQKLESLGVLAGGLAHDLNNLLSGVLGGVDLARLELPEGHPANAHLQTIRSAAQMAGRLCHQLLAYAGKGTLRVERLRLSEEVRRHDELLKSAVGAKASLRFCLQEDPDPTVEVDQGQLGQVLLNLVLNAAEAISESGRGTTVRVRTGQMSIDEEAPCASFVSEGITSGQFGFVEVADDGPGIAPEVLERIFDPFFSTKGAGRGLGLSSLLGIVRRHRGALCVQTEPGEGTRFKVLFPLVGEGAMGSTGRGGPREMRLDGRALVVDDNELVRRVVGRMLERLGMQVTSCASEDEASRALVSGIPDLRVVLLDLTMPGTSGEEAFRRIRRWCPETPVVLMSGFDEGDVASCLLRQGAAGFLQKPYELDELCAMLERVCSRATGPRSGSSGGGT